MNVAEIKSDLHRMVVETEDADLLEKVRGIFAILRGGEDWADMLNPGELEMVRRGMADAKAGNFVTDAEVRDEVEKILGR